MLGDFEITEEILKILSTPKKHWDASMDQIPEYCPHKVPLLEWCHDARANIIKPSGLILMGPYSSGKSAAAAICMKAAITQRVFSYWVSALNLSRYQIEKTPYNEEETIWERACRTPLLVLDEVQIEHGGSSLAWNMQIIEQLIRIRIDDCKCTIITTNNSREQIKDRRPSLYAAMQEDIIPITVKGYDFRKKERVYPKNSKDGAK